MRDPAALRGDDDLGLVALALGLVCIGTGVVLTTRRLRTPSEG